MTATQGPVERLSRRLGARIHGLPGLRRIPVPGVVTMTAVAMLVAHTAVRFWAASRSWFLWDDYIFIADVTRGDTGWAWLLHSHFSLVQPVAFAMVDLVARAGFTWWVYALHIAALQLAAAIACWVMLRVVFGNRRMILLPLAFYLFVPLTVLGSLWWSVAIYQWPFHIAIFGAIACHVVWLRSGRWQALIGTFAFTILGLGSYIKAPLIVMVLLGISLLWFAPGGPMARIRSVAKQWPLWAGMAVLVGGYAWIWINEQTTTPPRQTCEAVGVLRISGLETLGTSVVGGPYNWRLWAGGTDPFVANSNCVPLVYQPGPIPVVGGAPQSLLSPPLALIVMAWVLLVLLVTHRWARHRHSVIGLWVLVPYAAASTALVYLGRAGTFGSQISAREVRYFADIAVIGAFVLGTALMQIKGAPIGTTPRPEPFVTRGLPRSMVTWLTALFVIGSLVSTVTYALPWHRENSARSFPERDFVATVQSSVAAMDQRQIEIADTPLPAVVANPVIYPYNLPSRKLAPLGPRLRAVEQGTDLLVLDESGQLMPARIDGPRRTATGPVEDCGYLVQQTQQPIAVDYVEPGTTWAQVDYLANQDGLVDVLTGNKARRVPVERGLHRLVFRTDGDFRSVALRTDEGTTLCVDNVKTGPVVPDTQGVERQ